MVHFFNAAGPYQGHIVRTARKDWTCQRMVRWAPFERCEKPIAAGQVYVEGEVDPDVAGGFGMTRVCMDCARQVSE